MKCKVTWCLREATCKGYCSRHYSQVHLHGKVFERTRFDRNEVKVFGDVAIIYFYKRERERRKRVGIVDSRFLSELELYKWAVCKNNVIQSWNGGKTLLLYHLVWRLAYGEITSGFYLDHKDGDRLDNRVRNLRLALPRQNVYNAPAYGGTSMFKGVSRGYKGQWQAAIQYRSKEFYLGSYDSEEEAALVYDDAARLYHGEFARLNCPNIGERMLNGKICN